MTTHVAAHTSRSSPNFDTRTLPISMLVLHYTGMSGGKAALERLCDKTAKVSAHYVIEEDGRVFALVPEDKRAWHAGIGNWRGVNDINSASIGIEIVNGGHDFGLPAFPPPQIRALIVLAREIVRRQGILPHHIVGHSDIAPGRKQDPGERFPWALLAANDLGLWPSAEDMAQPSPSTAPPANAAQLRADFSRIGYGVDDASETDIITAFQRRFLPEQISGVACAPTRAAARSIAQMTPVL